MRADSVMGSYRPLGWYCLNWFSVCTNTVWFRDLLSVDSSFFKNQKHFINLTNGIFNLGTNTFIEFSPNHPILDKLHVKYNPEAKCELFLKMFLAHILEPDDVDLLQRYLSQVLEGINHSQTILVLTGDAGWGKSSLMKILGTMIGWRNVGIIREQLFKDEFELAHYADKNFLFHPDMPTDFLDRKEASIFKQLVGGDPLWANTKFDRRLVLEGNFPVVLACNGKPKIHLDQDTDAWLRRLVVLSLKTPDHEQHFGKMAELILKNEAPGILNWLLEGRAKLTKDKLQLTQTPEQKARAATLLLSSDSPSAFVRCSIQKQKGGVIWVADLYEHYQKWCRKHAISPSRSVDFMRLAKGTIETTFGLSPRHDLIGEQGRAKRGWSGLVVVEGAAQENVESQSSLSE